MARNTGPPPLPAVRASQTLTTTTQKLVSSLARIKLVGKGPVQSTPAEETQRIVGLTITAMQAWPQAELEKLAARFALPPADATRINIKSLQCDNEREYIFRCYHAVLGRLPDPQGLTGALQDLQGSGLWAGWLWRLRYSAEGRQHGVRIRGLWLAHRGEQSPAIGALARLLGALPARRSSPTGQ